MTELDRAARIVLELLSNVRCLQEAACMRDGGRTVPLMARRRVLLSELRQLAAAHPATVPPFLSGSPQWRVLRLQDQAAVQALRLAQAAISSRLARVRRRLQTLRTYGGTVATDRRGWSA